MTTRRGEVMGAAREKRQSGHIARMAKRDCYWHRKGVSESRHKSTTTRLDSPLVARCEATMNQSRRPVHPDPRTLLFDGKSASVISAVQPQANSHGPRSSNLKGFLLWRLSLFLNTDLPFRSIDARVRKQGPLGSCASVKHVSLWYYLTSTFRCSYSKYIVRFRVVNALDR